MNSSISTQHSEFNEVFSPA